MFSGAKQEQLSRVRQLLGGYGDLPTATDEELEVKHFPTWLPSAIREPLIFSGLGAAGWLPLRNKCLLYVAIVVILTLITGKKFLILGAVVAIWLPVMLLQRRAFKRAEGFERDYTALLLSLASGVRTGLDPIVALSRSNELFDTTSELGKELKRLRDQIDQGESEEAVISTFAADVNHPDVRLFRAAFILSRREGSSLAECLQRLAKVTRQRQSFRRKVRSAVAMQRLSAFGIGACCVIMGIIQTVANPKGFQDAWNHPLGHKALTVGILLLAAGLFWMIRLTRSKL
jgi:tight adherence protein B